MGINDESDIEASLQIGPTSEGRVRLYVEGEAFGVPMDFDPDEAEEIAEEILAAARQARSGGARKGRGPARAADGRGDGRSGASARDGGGGRGRRDDGPRGRGNPPRRG